MKIYHYSLQELGVKTIDLGKRGENKVREIEFDLRDWIAEYPGASVALYVSQPNTTVYLATTNMVSGVLRWPIIDTYTAIPGFGDAEIVLSGADGERLKSVTASIFVSNSLSDGAPGEAPDYMKPYVDQVAENAAKAEEALEEIKNIGLQSGNMPTGGSTGQILAKKSAENYDAHWIDPPSGSGTGGGVADSVAWDNVTDKPSTYPPAAHTHPEYLGKNETAANANQLNGKSADQYALKTDLPTKASDVGALASDGTAADSAKLNGKDSIYYLGARNLLDNSDFRNPVNQRGATNYTGQWVYSIDRWVFSGIDASLTINDEYVNLPPNTKLIQPININKVNIVGGNYTFTLIIAGWTEALITSGSIKETDGTHFELTLYGMHLRIYSVADSNYIYAEIENKTEYIASIKWAALYEGSYTADNLPPYVPKGYAAELAECQRYFCKLDMGNYLLFRTRNMHSVNGYGAFEMCPPVIFPQPMRKKPTVEISYDINDGENAIGSPFDWSEQFCLMPNVNVPAGSWFDCNYVTASADL